MSQFHDVDTRSQGLLEKSENWNCFTARNEDWFTFEEKPGNVASSYTQNKFYLVGEIQTQKDIVEL